MQKQQGIKRFSHFHGLALTSRLSIQPLPSTSMWFFLSIYVSPTNIIACVTRNDFRNEQGNLRELLSTKHASPSSSVPLTLSSWLKFHWKFDIYKNDYHLTSSCRDPIQSLLPPIFSPIRFHEACHKNRQVSGAEITKIECWNVAKWFIHGYKIATRSEFKQKRNFYDGRNLNTW